MNLDDMMAYAEVDEILNLLEDEYANRVPNKIRNFFKEEKIDDYKPAISADIPLAKQNLKRETIVLLAILNLNYWCDSEEEKEKFRNELAKNEKEKKSIEKQYNPDNIFKNKHHNNIDNKKIEKDENISIVEYKEQNLIKKLLNKIMRFFKK